MYLKSPTNELKKLIAADLAKNPHKREKFNQMNEQIETTREPYRLTIKVDELPKILTNSRGHWRATYAQNTKWKNIMKREVQLKLPAAPLTKAKLVCTRYSSRCPDADGLCSSFKQALDGLVEAGVLIDDNMSVIGFPTYLWEKVRPGRGAIKIEIMEIA